MNEALPAGTRLRGGALLIEAVLGRDADAFCYRAFDVPGRREITLTEHFPAGASRVNRSVLAPSSWDAPTAESARNEFLKNHCDNQSFFEENETIYSTHEYSVSLPVTQSSAPSPFAPSRAVALDPQPPVAVSNTPIVSHAVLPRRFSWHDILPDATRGAVQGAIAGATGGVLLGALAAFFGEGDYVSGAQRGLWALPIGALAGALLGALRALPSDAPQLATASAHTRTQQWQSTLSGVGKGVLLGSTLGLAFLLFINTLGIEAPAFSLLRAAVLFALSGAFGGGIVGFIHVAPRDRSRRS
jgi:hypothetical protein